MNKLEEQIREALIEQRAERLFELMNNRELQPVFEQNCRTIFQAMALTQVGDASPETTADAYTEKLKEDPGAFYDLARKTARSYFLTAGDYDVFFGHFFEAATHIPQGDIRLVAYRQACAPLYASLRRQQKVIDLLVSVALARGVEIATSHTCVKEAISVFFPTKDEYIRHQNGEYEALYRFITNAREIFGGGGTSTAGINNLLGKLHTSLHRRYEAMHEIREAELTERVNTLYGA
jgi:hypothetical protein